MMFFFLSLSLFFEVENRLKWESRVSTRQISQLENNFGSDKAAKCIEALKAEAANVETEQAADSGAST